MPSFTPVFLTLLLLSCFSCAQSAILVQSRLPQTNSKLSSKSIGLPEIGRKENTKEKEEESEKGNKIKKAKNPPKRKRRKSKLNLVGGAYDDYSFNWQFNSMALRDAGADKYAPVKEYFKPVVEEILKTSELLDYDTPLGKRWIELNESLVESFTNERGVIIYDQDYLDWMYCGWFTFMSNNIRMCAPLLPLGLEQIPRRPVKNKDYIPKTLSKTLHKRAHNLKAAEAQGEDNSGVGNGKYKKGGETVSIRNKFTGSTRDYVLLDLFYYSDQTYDQNCIETTSDRMNCDPICCYSTYIGSEFCSKQPMQCIYYGSG